MKVFTSQELLGESKRCSYKCIELHRLHREGVTVDVGFYSSSGRQTCAEGEEVDSAESTKQRQTRGVLRRAV